MYVYYCRTYKNAVSGGGVQHKLKVAPPRKPRYVTLAAYLELVEAGLSLTVTPRDIRRVYISWFTGTYRHLSCVLPSPPSRTVKSFS